MNFINNIKNNYALYIIINIYRKNKNYALYINCIKKKK